MRISRGTRARWAGAAVAFLLLSGCGSQGVPDDAPLEERLAAMPGVRAAVVETYEVEDGVEGTRALVDLEPDVSAAEAGDVLAEMEGEGGNTNQDSRVYLAADTTDWFALDLVPVSWAVPSDDAAVPPDVRGAWLVDGAAALPEAVVGVSEDRLTIRLPGGRAAEVGEAVRAVAADPTLSRVDDVTVRGEQRSSGGRVTPTHRVTSATPLTAADADAWERLGLAWEARVGRGGTLAWERQRDGRVEIAVELVLEPAPAPRKLTPAAYGSVLWPPIRASLDTLREAPEGSALRVTQASVSGYDDFLTLTVGTTPPARDRLGRTWNAEAYAYLTG